MSRTVALSACGIALSVSVTTGPTDGGTLRLSAEKP